MTLAFPKPRPILLEKTAKRKALVDLESDEDATVRERSGGVCEVYELGRGVAAGRCRRLAREIHHMIGGWGRRSRGVSTLAHHKQHVCRRCHREITGHVLQHIGSQLPIWSDKYRRIR